jgi:four helix bundle protein
VSGSVGDRGGEGAKGRRGERIASHRELRVWQTAMDLAMEVFQLSKTFPAEERYSLTDQIRRSSRSVAANISEAWRKRRYEAAFVSKLNDAEGEAAETQTHLEVARRCGYLTDAPVQALDERYEHLLAQLVTMAAHPEKWVVHPPRPFAPSPPRPLGSSSRSKVPKP